MNTKCENKFYDVTINDLIPLVLKQWRKILLMGIIIAVAFGLFKFIPLYYIANDYQLNATKISESEEEKKMLRESIEKIESAVQIKGKELDESIYYNLEPTMITRGFISFYIDTPIKDEALGNQLNLVNSYVSYFESGEIYDEIASQLDEYIRPDYLAQLVKTKTDYANGLSSFNIYVMGSNRDQISNIMQLIKQAVNNKKTEFANTVTEHTISVISENITVVSDAKVMKEQQFQQESFGALQTKLDDKKTQLQNIEADSITKTDALFSGLKFGFIGLLCGIVLAMIYFAVLVIFSNKIKTRKQIISNYDVDVLGEFIQENKKSNKLDVIISKMAIEPYNLSIEEINLIIANNIIAMSMSKKILIVGSMGIGNAEKIFDGISSCEILKDYEIRFNNKPMNNSETLANLLLCDAVIIIVKKYKTSLDELQNAIYTVENYKKDFIGVILA